MNMVMSVELTVFFKSIILGALLGVCYDIFRIIRIAVQPGKIAIFVQDILFFIITAAASFYFIVTFNEGIVRGYLLLGEALGFIIYYCTIGTLVFKLAGIIIKWIKKIFRFIFRIISWPFIRIFKLLSKLLKPLLSLLKKMRGFLKKGLLSIRTLLYNWINHTRKHKKQTKKSTKRKSKKWQKSVKRKKRGT